MKRESQENSENEAKGTARNPFGVMDVPSPNDQDVVEFASRRILNFSADDENAKEWNIAGSRGVHNDIKGNWSSRWNGGADPTISNDANHKWKPGQAEGRLAEERVYLFFNWDSGARKGLIDARRDGLDRLVGKYINLTAPDITRPWVGLIVSNQRIDGWWPGGRLDFRR
ncbi:MAG: hypothetical protein JWR80_4590 [Bradyrhizobium sp.]|nr:hypothetical protein [Bradyrhizobium sp.]